jgi:D-amino-acid dehydrogenase
MQVVVIGAGVIGVCTAYFLAEAGHDVVVIERHSNVAEEASFGSAGLVAPGFVTPWAAPGMPRKILSYLFKSEAPVMFKPTLDPALWRWMRLWLSECELERYRVNKLRMQRLAFYSRDVLQYLCETHPLDYERSNGYLQLFRTERELRMAQPALDFLGEHDIPHHVLGADAARQIEPALAAGTPLAGALHLPHDESGNCALFTRQMRYAAQSIGVEFHFGSAVRALQRQDNRVAMQIDDRIFTADAVVLATGVDSAKLLEPLGIRIPLYPVKGYSATAVIKNFDAAPIAAVMDESYKVAITRMGSRIRIAGTAELGSRSTGLREAALRTLIKVGEDWFPQATNYNSATFWGGARPTLPDGPPVLGSTPIRNVFVNIGHGSTGWAMAAGSGKVMADLVSGRTPDIDIDGLTLSRYG